MPEEIEVPTEHLHESIQESLEGHEGPRWISMVALTAALLAVLAAVAALFAGHEVNEAMMEQMQASDQWAFFQAKGIKAAILQSKSDVLTALGKPAVPEDLSKSEAYKNEQDHIKAQAEERASSSLEHLHKHHALARTVTLLQVAIALSAIAVLTKRRWLWLCGMALGTLAAGFFAQALL